MGLIALSCLLLATGAAAEDTITPAFAWPARTEAKVSVTLHRTDQAVGFDRVRTYDLSATFDMCALKNPAGHVRITFANRAFVLPADDVKDAFDILQRIPLLPLVFASTFVVDRDATLLRFEYAEDLRETLATLVEDRARNMPSFADYEGVALRMVRQDASDLVLERETVDWWSSSVGLWNGRTLTRGEPTRWTTMQPLPAPGGTTIEVARQFRFELVRRTPCLEGETEERCVELTMTSEIAEEDLKQAADKLRGGGGMHAEFPENGIEARVVTDPDTLLPYRVHRSRRSSMIMMQGEEQVAGGRQQDDIDMVYAYPVAPSGACDTGQ